MLGLIATASEHADRVAKACRADRFGVGSSVAACARTGGIVWSYHSKAPWEEELLQLRNHIAFSRLFPYEKIGFGALLQLFLMKNRARDNYRDFPYEKIGLGTVIVIFL